MVGRRHGAQSPATTEAPPGKHGEKGKWSPPLARPPPSLSAKPLADGADGSLQALTCPARALFHALLPAAASPNRLAPTARLSFAAAAAGELGAATQD